MISLTCSSVLCLILLTGAKSDDDFFQPMKDTSDFTESITEFSKLQTTALPEVETTVVTEVETNSSEAQTTAIPKVDTTTVPGSETTDIPGGDTTQLPLDDQSADFEKLVYNFIETVSRNENKTVQWFNFYDPLNNLKLQDLAVLKPNNVYDIEVPSIAFWRKEFINDTIFAFTKIGSNVISNDNPSTYSYRLEVPFYLKSFEELTPARSIKPSSWFHTSVNMLSNLFYNFKRTNNTLEQKTIRGVYETILEPDQALNIVWSMVWKQHIFATKVIVKFYGNIVIALEDGDDVKLLEYPLTDLANDDFVRNTYGLEYVVESYLIHTMPAHVIAETYASPNLEQTDFTGTLTIKRFQ